MPDSIRSEGGTVIGGGVGTNGGSFTGRDVIRTDVAISVENNNLLRILQAAVDKLEATTNLELRLLQRDYAELTRRSSNMADALAQMQQDAVLVKLAAPAQAANQASVSQNQLAFVLTCVFIGLVLIGVFLYLVLRV